ncbi:MAG: hypothetical protein NTV63_05380 [Candidatus Woesearchaeota archaeon]|nr:hypothetical protein [Candidatus Woesearchaeota archaeon]
MDDLYMKIGMVIVAISAMVLLMAFSFKSLNIGTEPEEKIQSVDGTGTQVYLRIAKLCSLCTSEEGKNRECFLLETNITSGNISKIEIAVFENFSNLTEGRYTLKISSNESTCSIRRVK